MLRSILKVLLITGVWVGAALSAPMLASAETVTVHKTPWCGCCSKWVKHLQDNGFDVEVHEHDDLTPIREAAGVPQRLASCHTGKVKGYALEGHVPAAEILRLLKERPAAKGLSVPGMPMGSPGMETPYTPDTYDVILFSEDGQSAYATYVGTQRVDETKDASDSEAD